MSRKNDLIKLISAKLLWPLIALMVAFTGLFIGARNGFGFMSATPGLVILVGTVGGFVSLQRRLHELPADKLELMAGSFLYTTLSPVVGGILAFLLYMLFLSGLLEGAVFPKFIADENIPGRLDQFRIMFDTHTTYSGYAALVFWSFVAGFSEKFVTNIIGQFERDRGTTKPDSDKDPTRPESH